MKRKVIVKQLKRGRYAGQWRFNLLGDNGKVLGGGELYNNYDDMVKTLTKYFPDSKIIRPLVNHNPKSNLYRS